MIHKEDIDKLLLEKHDLIRKLDSYKYSNDLEKEEDELKLLELNNLIVTKNIEYLKSLTNKDIFQENKKIRKVNNYMEARKLINKKYQLIREVKKESYEYYKKLIRKMEEIRNLSEAFKGKGRMDQLTKKDVDVLNKIIKI